MTEPKFRAGGGWTMMSFTGRMALAAALAAAIPIAAAAQVQDPKAKPGAAARPAAPAAHAAPRAAPHVAPRISAPRAVPHVAPHVATPHVARPQVSAPRSARPSAPQRAVTPHLQPPAAVNRNLERRQSPAVVNRNIESRQLRALRQREPIAAAQAKTGAVQTQQQQRLERRQQLQAERALRRREDRELRNLPAAQRAQRREEIRKAREQRALTRRQLVQPGTVQSNALTQRANRRSGEARLTRETARRGRFAAPFTAQAGANADYRRADNRHHRFARLAAHRAWRHGHRAAFVAWYGPIFWPYAYADIFDYTFWPYGYDDGYWAYVYDDFFDGVFWGDYGPPEDYVYAEPAPRVSLARPSHAAVRDLCRDRGSGVTAWPFADIERKVRLNAEQKGLLSDIRKASQDAAATFKASCPPEDSFPLTPPGRLDAMTARLEATLQAVQTVRPALETFYASLNDEQKERFNEIGPKRTATSAEAREVSQAVDTCKEPKPGLANLPIEKIEDAVNPTDAQQAELSKLQVATGKAVEI